MPKQLADKIRASGHLEGERRQVTVVFADLSGFTALAERLDPEEVASVLNGCMKELIEAVYQYEGMVHQIIGDCVMAIFGAPVALEDDAERALRAALAMKERLAQFNERWIDGLKEPLELHVGINTGTVIAGGVGSDLRMSYTWWEIRSMWPPAWRALRQVPDSGHTKDLSINSRIFEFRALEPVRVQGKRDSLRFSNCSS
jgi:class 3 adenylate cyclase